MHNATVVVLGSGGREHALCLALDASPRVASLHCIPGNAGTAAIATNHEVAGDVDSIAQFCAQLGADLVIVGPEAPLCDGLADACVALDVPCFGPVAALAHLEGSKLHAKETMEAAGVPTAAYQRLDASSNVDAALDAFAGAPWVVKRDVLAGGKGWSLQVTEKKRKHLFKKQLPQMVLSCWRLFCRAKRPACWW